MPTDRQMWELNSNQPKATWEKSWDSEPSMPAIATKLQATTKLKASGKEINSLERITVPKNQQVQVEKAENFTSLNLTRKWKQSYPWDQRAQSNQLFLTMWFHLKNRETKSDTQSGWRWSNQNSQFKTWLEAGQKLGRKVIANQPNNPQ